MAWGYTLQVKGKQERKFSGEWTREVAEQQLAARVLQLEAEDPRAPRTLAQVAQEYLDYKRAKGKKSLENDTTFIAHFKDFFGAETLITEVTAQQIVRYDSHRLTQASRLKRLLSPASVNRELATLRHLLRLAEEWGYIAKAPRVRLGREPEGRLRFLSEVEAARLLAACAESKSRYLKAIVTTALHTGMRRGEILGLTWELNRAVYDALSALPTEAREGRLFHRGGAAWGAIRTAFEKACTRAKLDDFRFHDLRHTCASWLIMRGRSLKEVQELLGHQTFAMTLRYAHLSPDRLRDAVASLDRPAEAPAQHMVSTKMVESPASSA